MRKREAIKEISEIGEFGLINVITKSIKIKNKSTVKGVGDDGAIVNYENKYTIVTTDILTEGVHFNLMYTPLKHLGYKAAIVNFSDVYAMNGIPKQITVALAISNKFTLRMIEELYEGIRMACDQYKVDLIGGDTSSSLTGMTIVITALGEIENRDIVYRDGAEINDLICVSGDLGGAYLGLQILERERKVFESSGLQPELKGYDYVLMRQLKPDARKDIITLFNELKIRPSAMIDISDGLSSELFHICEKSEKGCRIFADRIPIAPDSVKVANELNLEPIIAALNGGEDFELLFTIPANQYEIISGYQQIKVIGHITDKKEGLNLVTPDNQFIALEAQGWNTFDLKNKT